MSPLSKNKDIMINAGKRKVPSKEALDNFIKIYLEMVEQNERKRRRLEREKHI